MKATAAVAPASPKAFRLSPWHTPVPYFFGGLALLMCLIAFALVILVCSYGNLPDDDVDSGAGDDRDLEAGESKPDNHDEVVVFEEKYVVIMAGKVTPTFLATPVSSRATSFGSCGCSCRSNSSEVEKWDENKEKEMSSDHVQVRNMDNHESHESHHDQVA